MKISRPFFAMLAGCCLSPVPASAVIGLFERAYNLDGVVTSDAAPAGVSEAGFDASTGLGSVSVTVSGAGVHYVGFFVDHEIDEAFNTFFNEFGTTIGAPGAGLSWEIDEPGFVFGDIYTNFEVASLDNATGVGSPDDVSMALGWDFVLAAGEVATVTYSIGTVNPGGFYLQHTDPDSDVAIYFTSRLSVIPEPSAALLALLGLAAAGLRRRRR